MQTRKLDIYMFLLTLAVVEVLVYAPYFWGRNFGFLFPTPVYAVVFGMIGITWMLPVVIQLTVWTAFYNKSPEVFYRRAFVANTILTVLTIVWFFWSYRYGLKHQGLLHFLVSLAANLGFLVYFWTFVKKSISFASSQYMVLLTIFLVWGAIPYFGEAP